MWFWAVLFGSEPSDETLMRRYLEGVGRGDRFQTLLGITGSSSDTRRSSSWRSEPGKAGWSVMSSWRGSKTRWKTVRTR